MYENTETPRLIAKLPNGKLFDNNVASCNVCGHTGTMEHDFDYIFSREKIIICGNRECGIIIGTLRESPARSTDQQ